MKFLLFAKDWDFTLANYDAVWALVVQIGLLLLFLLLGNLLRTVIPFLRKGLVPSALIGGLLLFLVDFILSFFDINLVDQKVMQVITYHGLGIGFIAMTLKNEKAKNKTDKLKAVENGAMTGATYMLQAFVGIAITILFFLFTKDSNNPIYYASGIILPLGFGQGPGNALTWDVNFSNILENGEHVFSGNGSFGLTIASIGFIVASIFGVLYINIFKKKGEIPDRIETIKNNRHIEDYVSEDEIEDSESVDKFSIQAGLVILAYALAFGIMCIFAVISDFTNNIAWGFNFIWGVITATLIKMIFYKLKKAKIIKKNYINNYQMDRISGFSFDMMIVAGVAAIQIEDVKRYIWPLIILCAIGTIITIVYLRFVCKKRFKGYEHEMFVTNYGTLTGTASNGMILLKEIDPNYETPASSLFVISQFPAMICVAPLLLLLSFASGSLTNCIIAMCIFVVLFIAYNLFIFRDVIFKKKKV